MKYIKKKTYRLKNFFKEEIWELELEPLAAHRCRPAFPGRDAAASAGR